MPSIEDITAQFTATTTIESLENLYQSYLGKNGSITGAFKTITSLSPEEKKEFGSKIGEYKQIIMDLYESQLKTLKTIHINQQLQSELIDIHSIGTEPTKGHYHLLTQVRRHVEDLFTHLGFTIEYGNEIVTKYENFESVNIPLSHPATEMHDTYYLTQQDANGENLVLRTHTSAVQQKIIQKYGSEFKCIIPGKVYRCESTDVSHDTMFWQLEGMVVGPSITIPHFKGLMEQFLSELFQTAVTIRLRPSYFPFTEPSFEMDVSCTPEQPELYKLSKETGWLEIGGAGMIHPEVLTMAGLNPETHSGFAFGMGLTRLAAIKYKIRDIRYFTNGDLRFIQSF